MDEGLINSISNELEGLKMTLNKNTEKLSIKRPTNKYGVDVTRFKYFYAESDIVDSLFDHRINELVELRKQLSDDNLSKEKVEKKISSIEEKFLAFEKQIKERVHQFYRIKYFQDRSIKNNLLQKKVILEKINFMHNGFILKNYNIGNIKLVKIAIDLTVSNLLQIKYNYLEHLSHYVGGKNTLGCYFGIYPSIVPKQNFVKRGESFKAIISILPYEFEFNPNDIKLSVDGELIKYNKNKGAFVDYVSKPILSKNKTIKISCEIRNPITNNWKIAFKNKIYIINTVK